MMSTSPRKSKKGASLIHLTLRPGKAYPQALLRSIRTRRQKLKREIDGEKCNAARKTQIEGELENLRLLEHQECGTIDPPRRQSARELGFSTNAPTVEEILERATIWRYLEAENPTLMFAKLAESNPEKWRKLAEKEATQHPEIARKRTRIQFGDIPEIKWKAFDRVIAQHYFQSTLLRKPLRELSVDQISVELRNLRPAVEISPKVVENALRRLFLLG